MSNDDSMQPTNIEVKEILHECAPVPYKERLYDLKLKNFSFVAYAILIILPFENWAWTVIPLLAAIGSIYAHFIGHKQHIYLIKRDIESKRIEIKFVDENDQSSTIEIPESALRIRAYTYKFRIGPSKMKISTGKYRNEVVIQQYASKYWTEEVMHRLASQYH